MSVICGPPVHPRAGGEHGRQVQEGREGDGPSPRGRGTSRGWRRRSCARRSIPPARAGNIDGPPARASAAAVHPRAGGEHVSTCSASNAPPDRSIPARAGNMLTVIILLFLWAVHPRAGGEHIALWHGVSFLFGPSPRGRGTFVGFSNLLTCKRSIPARAGNIGRCPKTLACYSVHPRAGGEHFGAVMGIEGMTGPSPRGRGTLPRVRVLDDGPRSIPARAGNIAVPRPPVLNAELASVHPRAGGEHRVTAADTTAVAGPSPRGRGTLRPNGPQKAAVRSIPARAGNMPNVVNIIDGSTVHPRAGGEHPIGRAVSCSCCGPSPRGRGTFVIF